MYECVKKHVFLMASIFAFAGIMTSCNPDQPENKGTDVSKVDPATLDNTVEKCWYCMVEGTLEDVHTVRDGYMWGTEQQVVEDIQEDAKMIEEELKEYGIKDYSYTCYYSEATNANNSASCKDLDKAATKAYLETFSCWKIVARFGFQSETMYMWCDEFECKVMQIMYGRYGAKLTYTATDAADESACDALNE